VPACKSTCDRASCEVSSATSTSRMALLAASRLVRIVWVLATAICSRLTAAPNVARVFDTIAARFSDRHGGYTRILRGGPRRGDAAPMVLLELVDRVEPDKDGRKAKEKKAKAPKGEAGSATGGKRKKRDKTAATSA